jgi:LysR family nod box-dependent transcriptional activator
LLVLPVPYCSPEHPLEVVFDETFCCVVWKDSAMAKGRLTASRYSSAGHVVMQPPGRVQPSFETQSMQRLNIPRRIEICTFSFVAAVASVVGTERIATAHETLARFLETSLPIVRRPVPFALEHMKQAIQWHKYNTTDPGLIWLRNLFKVAGSDLAQAAPIGRKPKVAVTRGQRKSR